MNTHTNATFGITNGVFSNINAELIDDIWRQIEQDGIASVSADSYSYSRTKFGPPPANRGDWWRCDACRHANDWKHLACEHCGAQLPERYDE